MKSVISGLILCCSATTLFAADHSERMEQSSGDWQGVYAGATLGYGLLTDFNGFVSDRGEDVVYGFFAGYNHHVTENFVIGLEADYTDYDINFEKVPFIKVTKGGSLRARLGYALDNTMVYATAGLAFADTNINLEDYGKVVGAGVEYKFTDNVIFGVEYRHSWYRQFDNTTIDANLDIVRARLSFKYP